MDRNLIYVDLCLNKNLKCIIFSSVGVLLTACTERLRNTEPRAPHICADKSSFLTQLSNLVSFRGSTASSQRHFSGPRETAEQIGEQTVMLGHSHYLKSRGPQEVGWLHPTMNNNAHVVILHWHFLKWHFSHKFFIIPTQSPSSRGS